MLIAVGIVLVCLAAAAVALFRHPLAVTKWLRRGALRRAGFRMAKVPASFGAQAVWHGGQGPMLVLLHGAGDHAGTWFRVAPALARRFRVVMPDLAGHGESEPTSGILRLATLCTALEEVLNSADFRTGNFILGGNSLGAWLALIYATKNPARVTRLVLIDGGPLRDLPDGLTLTPQTRAEALRTFDAVLDRSSPRPPGFVLDDVIRATNRGAMARLMAAGPEDRARNLLEDDLPRLSVPTDLVWGASDGLLPLAYARELQSRIPGARLSVIDNCGHAPQLEHPRAFLEVLTRILASS